MTERTAGGRDGVVLELAGVTKQFGRVTAVDRLSERFAGGEYFCILGPSGCGKTTLLRLIAGFETPDTGVIRLHGDDVARTPPERRDVNVVFQQYALFPHLTVTDNIGFGLRMKKLPRTELRQRVRDALRLVHLEEEAERLPQQLSGGQQQRVAVARALVNRPAVLLLDEPLSALDHALRLRMQEELRRIQRETRVTFLHITHDQAEALSLADRIAVMRHGRFLQVGSPRDVYLRPASRFVASFVGAANLLAADVDASGWAAVAGFRLRLPGHVAAGPAVLAIRPEAVQLVPSAGASSAGLIGTVRHLAFTGADVDVAVAVPNGTLLRARVAPAAVGSIAEGDTVAIVVSPDEIVVLPPEEELMSDVARRDRLAAAAYTAPALLYLGLLFLVPMAVVAGYSLRSASGGVTLAHYQRALDPLYLSVLLRSAWLALVTTVIALAVGYPCALALRSMSSRARTVALALIVLPSWLNLLVKNYAWIVILRRQGVVNTLLSAAGVINAPLPLLFNDWAVLTGLVHTYLPFMILPLYAAVDRMDGTLLEAARDLGAGRWHTFRHVVLPQTRTGALVGTVLVFIPTLGAFVTPDLLGGARSLMIANLIENQVLQARDWPFAAALSMFLIALVLLALAGLHRATRGREVVL